MPQPLPHDLSLGPVGLAVRDLDRSLRFYTDRLGLSALEHEPGRALLDAGTRPLLELIERPDGKRDEREAGLFHVALRVPDRAALARTLRRLLDEAVPLTGASDHVVSEALYLDDPDGHGLEIYADRPREAWYRNGKLTIETLPLDGRDLLTAADRPAGLPEATVVGHVHLETHDLAAARRFYVDGLGLEIMAEVPRALFLAQGGYHHHLAVNGWRRRQRPAEDRPDRIGLLYYTLIADRTERLVDPSGLEVRVERSGTPTA